MDVSLNGGAALIGDDPNFKVYFHSGACHSEREADGNSPAFSGSVPSCDYDNMIQAPKPNQGYNDNCQAGPGQVCFRDWVRGWAGNPGYSWGNVK
jgi:hypothetical protein